MKRAIVLLVFFIFASLICQAQNKQSLVAWWPFDDGTARDYTGNGYDGTLMNSPKLITGYNGKGYAFQFEGYGINETRGSHITLPFIDFVKLGEFTIMLWAKFDNVTCDAGEAYFFFGDHSNGWLGILNHVRQPEYDGILYIQFSVGSDLNYGSNRVKPIEYLYDVNNNGKWVYYALTYKNNILKAYINGKLVGSITQDINIVGKDGGIARHWWMGNGSSTRLNGAVDDVKVYGKALTDDEILNQCDESAFDFPNFYKTNSINFVNSASIVDSNITLTPPDIWRSGAAWYKDLLPIKNGFTTQFSFSISEGSNKYHYEKYLGADGLAFVIQNEKQNAIGLPGGSLGFRNISNSFAVEYDTYQNNDPSQVDNFNDPNENHVGVFFNGTGNNLCDHNSKACLATNDSILPMVNDGRTFYSKIEYNIEPNKMKIWLDSNDKFTNPPIIILDNLDLSKKMNLDQGEFAWVGFTSGTAVVYEKHEIKSWSFCPAPTDAIWVDVSYQNLNDGNIDVFPNPSQDLVNVDYYISSNGFVSIELYDVMGKKVEILDNGYKIIGKYNILFSTSKFSIGIYYLIIHCNGNIITKTINII